LAVEEQPIAGLLLNLPRVTDLFQSRPNPMVKGASIRYQLAQESEVTLVVYNVAGERVRTLVRGKEKAGYYTATWDGKGDQGGRVASGVYFYRLDAGGFVKTRKMVVTR
jgi:hypothetical protein